MKLLAIPNCKIINMFFLPDIVRNRFMKLERLAAPVSSEVSCMVTHAEQLLGAICVMFWRNSVCGLLYGSLQFPACSISTFRHAGVSRSMRQKQWYQRIEIILPLSICPVRRAWHREVRHSARVQLLNQRGSSFSGLLQPGGLPPCPIRRWLHRVRAG